MVGRNLILGLLFVFAVAIVGLAAYVHTNPHEAALLALELERDRTGWEAKTIDVSGSWTLGAMLKRQTETWHYLENEGVGTPLILLHGYSADKDNWLRYAPYLPDQYMIAPDLPGFGESKFEPNQRYDMQSQALKLHAFIRTLGIDKVHIAGNSMGGQLAATYAGMFTDAVESVFLLNPGGLAFPEKTKIQQAFDRGENPLLVRAPADFDKVLAAAFFKPPFVPEFVLDYQAQLAVQHLESNARIFQDFQQDARVTKKMIRQATAPIAVVWGDKDYLLHPSGAKSWKLAVPTADVATIPDCGHLPMIECPEPTAALHLKLL